MAVFLLLGRHRVLVVARRDETPLNPRVGPSREAAKERSPHPAVSETNGLKSWASNGCGTRSYFARKAAAVFLCNSSVYHEGA